MGVNGKKWKGLNMRIVLKNNVKIYPAKSGAGFWDKFKSLNKKIGTINDTPQSVWTNEALKEFIRHDCKCNICPHWFDSVMDMS